MAKLVQFTSVGVKVNQGTAEKPENHWYKTPRYVPTDDAIKGRSAPSAIMASLEEFGPSGVAKAFHTISTGSGLLPERGDVHVAAKGGGKSLTDDKRREYALKLSGAEFADWQKAGLADTWLIAKFPQASKLEEISEAEAKLLNSAANAQYKKWGEALGVVKE